MPPLLVFLRCKWITASSDLKRFLVETRSDILTFLSETMTDPIRATSDAMDDANSVWDAAVQQVAAALNMQDPLRILPYRGYGTPEKVYIKGRVLEKDGIEPLGNDAPLWKNAVNMYRRFESDEIELAQLQARLKDCEKKITANEEGFFEVELTLASPIEGDRLWQNVELTLLDPPPRKQSSVTALGNVLIVRSSAQFGVISDIDDTVVYTAADKPSKMIEIAYLGNEHSRRAFAGVTPFYQALRAGKKKEGNPIFYVSSSPWNMYDLFVKFMDLTEIPLGPILLRDIELSPENLLSFNHSDHKREQIDPVLKRFSDLPFILIGDIGQKDAEIYSRIVEDYPDRIRAVYIRDVLPKDKKRHEEVEAIAQSIRTKGVEFKLFTSTFDAAKHAVNKGWIDEACLDKIATDVGIESES